MPPRPPSTPRIARRCLPGPVETLWISDHLLSTTFQNFCRGSLQSRRNGSSVPGPMEFRRRQGRRKLTCYSEAGHAALQDFGTVWGFPTAGDRHAWQWQPPSNFDKPVKAPRNVKVELPNWLRNYEPEQSIDTRVGSTIRQRASEREVLESSYAKILASNKEPAELFLGLCSQINSDLERDIARGVYGEDSILWALEHIPEAMMFGQPSGHSTQLALNCCQCIWAGLKACKVLSTPETGQALAPALFAALARVDVTLESQGLILTIASNLSWKSFPTSHAILSPILEAWTAKWATLIKTPRSKAIYPMAGFHSRQFKGSILHLQQSTQRFINLMAMFPHKTQDMLVRTMTKNVIISSAAFFEKSHVDRKFFRRVWLVTVAKLPGISINTLFMAWRQINRASEITGEADCIRYLQSELCDLTLFHWACRKEFNNGDVSVSNYRNLCATAPLGRPPIACLFRSLWIQGDLCQRKTSTLFRLMRIYDKPEATFSIMQDLADSGIKFPLSDLANQIGHLIQSHPLQAFGLFKIHHSFVARGDKSMAIDDIPGLAERLIDEGSIHSLAIWGAMGVRDIDGRFSEVSVSKISPARVETVEKMAIAFARSSTRTRRYALRNVVRCFKYLKLNGVPPSAEISRALAFVGITRDLLDNKPVGNTKLAWLLEKVEQAEGQAVAKSLDLAVYGYSAVRRVQRIQEQRNLNPLRLGPID